MLLPFTHTAVFSLLCISTIAAQDESLSNLLERGDSMLAGGRTADALSVFSSAIEKDKNNYLTYFKRATTYLAMSRHSAALSDLNTVLSIKPDFTSAVSQRGKVMSSLGQWDAAMKDLQHERDSKTVLAGIKAARKSAASAGTYHSQGNANKCVEEATAALAVASASPSLRLLRARCLVMQGEVEEAIGDLVFAARLNPSDAEIQMLSANLFFFGLADEDRGIQQLKACLHYDPDAKACKQSFRKLKSLRKAISSVRTAKDARTWTTAKKSLKGSGDSPGVIAQLHEERDRLISEGILNAKLRLQMDAELSEIACEVFAETKESAAMKFCDEALVSNPNSITSLRAKATILTKDERFEEALETLKAAQQAAGGQDRPIQEQFQKVQRLLKLSKQKDYYKVLGVARDADTKTIKKSYRTLTKEFHPDRYRGDLPKEQVIKKIEGINEAYEVLTNPELRQRFDNGEGSQLPQSCLDEYTKHGRSERATGAKSLCSSWIRTSRRSTTILPSARQSFRPGKSIWTVWWQWLQILLLDCFDQK